MVSRRTQFQETKVKTKKSVDSVFMVVYICRLETLTDGQNGENEALE